MSGDAQVPPGIPGDVGQLSMLQGNFAAIAQAATTICTQLQNTSGQIVWCGMAHDAFQAVLQDVPYDLEKISTSFGLAATALQNYLGHLPDLQSKYQWTVRQYLPACEQQQQARGRLWSMTQGLPSGGTPSVQQQTDAQSLQDQIDRNQPEVDRLYGQLVDLYGQAEQAARDLAKALGDASTAGIKDDLGNAWNRYSGDVTGAISSVVTGLVHDVQELVAAVGNLGQTLWKMAGDIAHGNWDAVAKDAEQALVDIHDICKAVSDVLMTLTPILSLIPGVGEIVAVLDVIALVATMATVGTDLVMVGVGGTAVDPLTGQQIDVRQAGEQSLVGDTLNLAFTLVPGGRGVADDMAHDAEAGAIREGQTVDAATSAGTFIREGADQGWTMSVAGGEATFAGAERWNTTMEQAFAAAKTPGDEISGAATKLSALYDTKPVLQLSDLLHLRQLASDSLVRAQGLWIKNPVVFNHFGVSLNYRTFRLISAGVHGGELAHTGYEMFEGHGAGR